MNIRSIFLFVFSLAVTLFSLSAFPAIAQEDGRRGGKPKQPPKPAPECNIDGFSTTVDQVEELEGGCIKYSFTVKTNGTCRYDLSHYTVAIPCGTVQDIYNSRNWKVETGTDPTTGLTGFKIDDVPYFGKEDGDSFVVEFVVCRDEQCSEAPTQVAYKAGQCIKYETLIYNDDPGDDGDGDGDDGDDDDGDDDGGGGDDGGGDDGGGDDGGGDDGGGDDGGGDDGSTCSTLLATLSSTSVNCSGQADGSASVDIQDGLAPIAFSWSNGATTQSIQDLAPGTYSVTVTDASGNLLTLSAEITEPAPLIITGEATNPSCGAALDGAITVDVSGGTGGYTYSWNNNATTPNIIGLGAGTYTLTVTDEAGCSQQKSFQLVNTTQINLSAITTKTACAQSGGSIDLTVSGGTGPYSFAWTTGATTEDLQNLNAGSYRVVVTDANGCQTIGTYFVQEINDIKISFQTTKSNCNNDPTGTVDMTVVGGSGTYTYLWQHGPTTEDLTGLVSGTYRVTVTDQVGCSALVVVLVQRETLQINAQVIQPSCADDPSGSILLTPVNGTGPYAYEWSNGNTTNMLIDVPMGNYVVTVWDLTTGCSITLSYTLSAPAAIGVTAVITNSACGEEGNYNVNLSVTGGRSPYQVLWSSGQIGPSVSGLASGTYQVQVKDANNCISNQEVIVSPESFQWTCLISPLVSEPVCQSVGNIMTSSIQDADSYQWTLISTDNSWELTSGINTANAIYSVGNPNTMATFTLTVEKDGCIQSCSYEVTGNCEVKDNTGGGNPDNGDPCAESVAVEEVEPVTVPLEEETAEEEVIEDEEEGDEEVEISSYPNPFDQELSFEWTCKEDDYARLAVYDQNGRLLKVVYEGEVRKGGKYRASWKDNSGLRGIFYYRYHSNHKQLTGKLLKK